MGMELDFQQNKYDPSPQAEKCAVCPEISYLSLVLMFDPAAKLLKCRVGPMGYANIRILSKGSQSSGRRRQGLPRAVAAPASPCQGHLWEGTFHMCTVIHFHISHNSTRNCSHTARKLWIIFLFKDSDHTVLHLMGWCTFMQIQMPLSQLLFPTKQQSISLLNFPYIILTLPTYVIWCKAPNISHKLRVILAFYFNHPFKCFSGI